MEKTYEQLVKERFAPEDAKRILEVGFVKYWKECFLKEGVTEEQLKEAFSNDGGSQ